MPKQSFIMILTIFLKTFFQITSKLKNWYITLFLKWANGRGWGGIILNFIQYLHYKLYTKIVFLCSAHFVEYKCFLYCQDATEARIALRANNDTKGLCTRATNIVLLIAIFPHDALRIISLKCRHWLRTWQLHATVFTIFVSRKLVVCNKINVIRFLISFLHVKRDCLKI